MTTKDWPEYFDPNETVDYDLDDFDWQEWVKTHASKKGWQGKVKPEVNEAAGNAAKDMYTKLIKKKDDGGPECPPEIATDLSLLSLYNVILLLGKYIPLL